jgi:hypothetical protein
VTVSGNGTYATPTGYTPTSTGTYQWHAAYSGDSNNTSANDQGGSAETELVTAASPTLTTSAGGPRGLGDGLTLSDSAVLSSGFNETGTITFTLKDPSNKVVDTETVSISGNGTYATPTGYSPTVAGTYQWSA